MSVRKHRKIGGRYHWSNCLLFDYEFLLRWMTAGYSSLTIYCRVAYPDMDMLETQKRGLIDYAQKNHFTIVGITAEQGSGLDLSREGLTEVFDAVNDAKVDVLLVKDLARLGRNWAEVCGDLAWLKEQHVRLVCEDGPMPETSMEILHRIIAEEKTKVIGKEPGKR